MRRLARDQEGYAVPMVMGALLLMLAIAALAVQESVSFSVTSNRDRNSKAALAAAQAGVQAARLRIASVGPRDDMCVSPPGGTLSESPQVSGNCPTAITGRIGTDGTYEYYATPALASSDTSCAGAFIEPSSVSPPKQRCVTSTGIAHGVKRRVQVRVASTPSKLNPVDGLFGLNSVDVGAGGSQVNASVGTNGTVTAGSNAKIDLVELFGPTASAPKKYAQVRYGTPAALAPVDVGNTATVNNNAAIPAGYSASGRDLVLNSTIELPGGDYNLCHIDFGSGGIRAKVPGETVRIFVDAPQAVRPGSLCPNGGTSGRLEGSNGVSLGIPDGVPADLQIYVHGWAANDPYATGAVANSIDVGISNNLDARAFIYAPQSDVDVKNNANITGAIVGRSISVKNKLAYYWDPSVRFLGYGDYSRRDWRECRDAPSDPADPESGCP